MQSNLANIGLSEFMLWLRRRRRRVRVTGDSMLPLLAPGDEVLVDPGAYRRTGPRPGDIVIARHPYRTEVTLIKRVESLTAAGQLVLKGDNPAESTDSRTFGTIGLDQVIGKVTCRFA
ncbi:MAG: nickel-type superoxide dismutase maturation protease [Anaerolineae bacterium]|nr:nickel-type superoxide dismutase maturation protease [Anaerolineae bacterium]